MNRNGHHATVSSPYVSRPSHAKQRRTKYKEITQNNSFSPSWGNVKRTLYIQTSNEDNEDNSLKKRKVSSGLRSPDSAVRKGQDEVKKQIMDILTKATRTKYPELHKRVYLKPPVHFNRVTQKCEDVGGATTIKLLVPASQMSDVRENEAKQRIHSILSRMFHRIKGPAFVVFELDFDNYLNDPRNVRVAEEEIEKAKAEQNDNMGEKRHLFWAGSPGAGPQKPGRDRLPNLGVFPRPRDRANKGREDYRGRFDVLIIHSLYGIMIFDVRAIGDVFGVTNNLQSTASQMDATRKKIRKSLEQLDKEEDMVRYLCSDLFPEGFKLRVTKGLMLPNLDKQTVTAALLQDSDLVQSFCRCLGENDLERALELCIFRDRLPPIGRSVELSDDNVNQLLKPWWKRLTEKAEPAPSSMDMAVYEAIIARFCGPGTSQYVNTSHNPKADVSTTHNAVLQAALCFSDPVLTEEQMSLVKSDQGPWVYIAGPPATAKSIILQLKSEQWLQQGETVFVLSLWEGSETASRVLYHKIKDAVSAESEPRLHCMVSKKPDFSDVLDALDAWVKQHGPPRHATKTPPTASTTLSPTASTTLSTNGTTHRNEWANPNPAQAITLVFRDKCRKRVKLFLVIDEAPWFLDNFVSEVQKHLRGSKEVDLVIWAASTISTWMPNRFSKVLLTRSLRCPPVVVREMMQGSAYSAFNMDKYSRLDAGGLAGMPSPTDGPPVKRIQHGGHKTREIIDCYQCGRELAAYLTKELKIGTRHGPADKHNHSTSLYFSDVLISGYVPSLAGFDASNGFIRGLRDGEVLFDVIRRFNDVSTAVECPSAAEKLAAPSDKNHVQIAEPESVLGLERPVVVVIGATDARMTYPRYVDPWFHVMSRCTSQLVIVDGAEMSLEPT